MTTTCTHGYAVPTSCIVCMEEGPVAVSRPNQVLRAERWITARYTGRCARDQRHAIEDGDRIGYLEDFGWVCEGVRLVTINAADLDPATRKRLGLSSTTRKRPRTTQRTGPHEPVQAGYWRCPCGHTSSVWDPMERHANACARRVEIDLTRALPESEN